MKVEIINRDTIIHLKRDETLLDGLLRHKIDIDHSCNGMGSCGTCRVFVETEPSGLQQRNEIEQERAEALSFIDKERLSCQIQIHSDIKIKIPE